MDLPVELLVQVFGELEVCDVIRSAAVCSQWRGIIHHSDFQIFKTADLNQCDYQRRMLPEFGAGANSALRVERVQRTIQAQKPVEIDRVVRAAVKPSAPFSYFSMPHSASDEQEEEEEQAAMAQEIPGVYRCQKKTVVVYPKNDKHWVLVRDECGGELAHKSVDLGSLPEKVLLTSDTLIMLQQDKISYYSFPQLDKQGEEQNECCDLRSFGPHVMRPPQTRSDCELSVRRGGEWQPMFRLSQQRFHHLQMNNFSCASPRHVLVAMTRHDMFMYHYLFVFDMFTNSAKSYVHVSPIRGGYGTWHVDWDGEACYVL